jgi:hypothetical protein
MAETWFCSLRFLYGQKDKGPSQLARPLVEFGSPTWAYYEPET